MKIEENIDKLYAMMDKCELCPRKCGVNRNAGQKEFAVQTTEY